MFQQMGRIVPVPIELFVDTELAVVDDEAAQRIGHCTRAARLVQPRNVDQPRRHFIGSRCLDPVLDGIEDRRSEGRLVGKASVRTCESGWTPASKKKKKTR